MIIRRREAESINKERTWTLIYGRRKTGKTFILRNFVNHDHYFYVRRDGVTLAEGMIPERIERTEDLTSLVRDMLKSGRTVIIDEFQHLPHFFLEEISTVHPKGRLILSGSSMRIVHEIFSSNSPLLGMLSEHRIGMIKPGDILRESGLNPEKTVQYGAYIRDPWTIPMFRYSGDFLRDLWNVVERSKNAIPGLIGEIFSEEERRQSRIYEIILRIIGSGVWSSGEIAHTLYTRGILEKDDSRLVMAYIKNMKMMDLVEEIPLMNSRRKSFYRVKSPIMETFYYLADRHNIEERDITYEEVKENLRKMANLAVERFVADAFAELYGGTREYSLEPEIDFAISEGRKRKIVAVGEVKWGADGKRGIKSIMEKTEGLSVDRIVFARKGCTDEEDIICMTPEKLVQKFKEGN